MDGKVGNGAFADTQPMAAALAKSIVAVAEGAGLSSVALVTDMNQPLGQDAGNALEVADCIELLTGGTGDRRFCEVTLALAEEMLLLGGVEIGRAHFGTPVHKAHLVCRVRLTKKHK